MFVKVTKKFDKGFEVGKTYEIDTDTAESWVDAGLAEKTANPADNLIEGFEKALSDREERLFSKLTEAVKTPSRKPSANIVVKDETKSFGDFLINLAAKNYSVLEKKYGSKAVNITTAGEGGNLVPVEYVDQLLAVDGFPTLWQRANQYAMGSDQTKIPVLDQTVTPSNGSSAFFAGVSIGFVAEATAPNAETKPLFKQLTLNSNKLIAYTNASSEVLQDAKRVDQIITDQLRAATNSYLDYMVLNGSGTTQPQGIIGYAATHKQTRNNSNAVDITDVAKMYARLPQSCRANAAWVVSPSVLDQLITMNSGATNGVLVWLPNGSALNGLDMRLFGLPVLESEHCPNIGAEGDVVLADFSKYALGVRRDIEVAVSTDFAFTSDVVTFRLTMRVDGRPQLTAKILCADGSYNISPFITLDDVAS